MNEVPRFEELQSVWLGAKVSSLNVWSWMTAQDDFYGNFELCLLL